MHKLLQMERCTARPRWIAAASPLTASAPEQPSEVLRCFWPGTSSSCAVSASGNCEPHIQGGVAFSARVQL